MDEVIIINLNLGIYYVRVWCYKLYSWEVISVNYNLMVLVIIFFNFVGDDFEMVRDLGMVSAV